MIDEKVASLIRKMFEIYAKGKVSLKKLVEIMYDEGIKNRERQKLVKSRIAELLSNPFYYGKIRWKGKLYDGKHKSLISKELFDRVQSILKAKKTPKYRKHFYLFKGLIRCAECKGLITWVRLSFRFKLNIKRKIRRYPKSLKGSVIGQDVRDLFISKGRIPMNIS